MQLVAQFFWMCWWLQFFASTSSLPTIDILQSDQDQDGIDDALEDALATTFAPEVRLAPDSMDWARPANVDWFLQRVALRYHHGLCHDCPVLPLGSLTQSLLAHATHPAKSWTCSHDSDRILNSSYSEGFYLQPEDPATNFGASLDEWKVYVHVRRSRLIGDGYDIQYWFFYPYNKASGLFDHEGDWEHITVTVDANRNFVSAWYSQHLGGARYLPPSMSFVPGTWHPIVYSAAGTHASYPRAGEFPLQHVPFFKDKTSDFGPVWRTWDNWVNLGERGHPRSGQDFIDFSGRFGRFDTSPLTYGPLGPAFHDTWDTH
jgi:hypothetical protein